MIRKILVSVKCLVRNSGAGSGCANFMGAWKNAFLLQENLHVHKIPCFRGGIWGFGEGGGKCRFHFYGRGDFSGQIHTYLHETPQKTKTNMYNSRPPRPRLRAPNKNKTTRIRAPPCARHPGGSTYWHWGVQTQVGLEPAEEHRIALFQAWEASQFQEKTLSE